MTRLSPPERLARYGPTIDDRIRLGDTDLWVRVEEDRQAPGDEPIWGYAKTIRPRATQGRASPSELDVVVAGAVVVDPAIGVVKADIGIKDGRVVGVGRAGSGAVSDGIDLPIGPHTQPIMGYGLIATPGAIDSHVHLISPELLPTALSGGVTTLITAGFEEPPWAMARTLAGVAEWPLNIGLQACARSEDDGSLEALLDAGACGFKIHEDYGAHPELIDHVLRFADTRDVSVALHTDGLHESAELEDTVAAIDGRTVHAYHVEGSGGGHVPDVIGLVREPNVICSSTTPTVPFGINAAAEQVPMIVLNHGASFGVAEDIDLVRDRVHTATMAAEGPLHELGAIAIVNSDSQGMGRMMETVRRTIQLAHVMADWDGTTTADDPFDASERVLRYLAKVTIEPAITHGVSDHVGSLQAGRIADIVLWEPAYFGVKPALVLKGGMAAWAPLGDGNATVERA
ncbi:MAG TPA: urease subunit alpha, partial [Candidatus Limnocylindrales bacterium]|nr:urease subunit alpha [Candidatus Limnocylindrales bacterium]